MEPIDLASMQSLTLDALSSPWANPDKMLQDGLWDGSGSDDAGLEDTTIGSSSGNAYSPYSGSNACLQGGSWPVQALKTAECSIEPYAGEACWAPTNLSGSWAQHTEAGHSERLPALAGATAEPAAAHAARVVRRSRARRNQGTDGPSPRAMELEQAHVQQQAEVQTLEPTAPQRPDWVLNKGPTLSGVVMPFESVKGCGASSSRTLLQINTALKNWQQHE